MYIKKNNMYLVNENEYIFTVETCFSYNKQTYLKARLR